VTLPLLKDAGDLRGKRVFLAIDLNLAIQNGKVVDAYRLERSQKTIEYLRQSGARTLLVSHRTEETASLVPVFEYLKTTYDVVFAASITEARKAMETSRVGSFVLLENIRKVGGDREKNNDFAFACELSSLADIFINEAFSISHRSHASIIGVPAVLPHYAGFLLEEEVEELSKAFDSARPSLVILGGAKFETKMPLVKRFLQTADNVVVCGALANDIYRFRGYETGISLLSKNAPDLNEIVVSPKLYVPVDVVTRGGEVVSKSADVVLPNEKIVDAGPDSLEDIRELIEKAAFILWNGPLGEYEDGFIEGTEEVAQAIAESDAESIVGGGDSLAMIDRLGLKERFSFVSTGGGAMLEFLANGTLPGIEALKKYQ